MSDLNKLGGLLAVTRELNHSDPGIRTVAAWILGKAGQNNPILQQQVCFSFDDSWNIWKGIVVLRMMEAKQYSDVVKCQLSQVLELGVLSRLTNMVKSNSVEEANKALYAVSALIRNNAASQELFYAEAGGCMLQVT